MALGAGAGPPNKSSIADGAEFLDGAVVLGGAAMLVLRDTMEEGGAVANKSSSNAPGLLFPAAGAA